jgi:hypothetical protein
VHSQPKIPLYAPNQKRSAFLRTARRIGTTLKADIDAGRIPGAVIAIVRHGKLLAPDAYGWRDKAAGVVMTSDTIFNIASMTKPMTTVGALMLYEQGKILIDVEEVALQGPGNASPTNHSPAISWRQTPRAVRVRKGPTPPAHDAGGDRQ